LIIQTKYFGKMVINKNKIINFPDGLPAFRNQNKFVIIDLPDNHSFYCLQSVQEAETAFLMIRPWDFFPDYDFVIPDQDLEELGITSHKQVLIYNIVTIPEDFRKMTANLMAPIVINSENLKGRQVILQKGNYQIRHPFYREKEVV
jgi:flagellar assembly factor FliW